MATEFAAHPPASAMSVHAVAPLQLFDEMEKCFLVHGLNRAGDVAVPVGQGFCWFSPGAEQGFKFGCEKIAANRRSAVPLLGDGSAVMPKISKIERIAAIRT